ncbi:MAG: HXXEE domain-containing protein [Muribaculaceae bacterium]
MWEAAIFPILFCIHDAEEIFTQHRWMREHGPMLKKRFPRMGKVLDHLGELSTGAFAIAVIEELLIIIAVTLYYLVGGAYSFEIWVAVFLAFSLHLVVHIGQAVVVGRYTPGVVTSVVVLPYCCYKIDAVMAVSSPVQLLACGIAGVAFMVVNLLIAHRIGKSLAKKRQ